MLYCPAMASAPTGTGDSSLIPPVEKLYDGSSSTEQFVAFGEGFVHHILVPRAGLQSHDIFLDVGCGNGSVARALTTHLGQAGRYEGLDVDRSSVAWLQERYEKYPAFHFTHANVYNKMYNPSGPVTADRYRLPYDDATFSIALLKSVFTHMLPTDVRPYLQEIARVLRPGARALVTYFLLNDESRRLVARNQDEVKMRFDWDGDPLCRVANLEVPEHAIAHDEGRIRAFTADSGLTVSEIVFGNWCGRPSLLGLQDLMILLKP